MKTSPPSETLKDREAIIELFIRLTFIGERIFLLLFFCFEVGSHSVI